MKNLFLTFLLTAFVVVGCASKEKKTPPPPPPPESPVNAKQEKAMETWEQFASPGTPHKILESLAGKWKYTSKMWQSPTSLPEESTGRATLKMILGGRFLQNETKGKAMGKPFEGFGLTGYNNLTDTYETFWIDDFSTAMMHGTGTFDEATQTLKDKGEFSFPTSPSKKMKYRAEWTIVDKNNSTYTMWTHDKDGKEFKTMEMSFTRTKK